MPGVAGDQSRHTVTSGHSHASRLRVGTDGLAPFFEFALRFPCAVKEGVEPFAKSASPPPGIDRIAQRHFSKEKSRFFRDSILIARAAASRTFHAQRSPSAYGRDLSAIAAGRSTYTTLPVNEVSSKKTALEKPEKFFATTQSLRLAILAIRASAEFGVKLAPLFSTALTSFFKSDS